MKRLSLGFIETLGMTAAVVAADAAGKTANVSLLPFECVGAGRVTLTCTGDVGAVRAAVTAGAMAANKVGRVLAVHVIARPYAGHSGFQVRAKPCAPSPAIRPSSPADQPPEPEESLAVAPVPVPIPTSVSPPPQHPTDDSSTALPEMDSAGEPVRETQTPKTPVRRKSTGRKKSKSSAKESGEPKDS